MLAWVFARKTTWVLAWDSFTLKKIKKWVVWTWLRIKMESKSVFQAENQAKIVSIESPPRNRKTHRKPLCTSWPDLNFQWVKRNGHKMGQTDGSYGCRCNRTQAFPLLERLLYKFYPLPHTFELLWGPIQRIMFWLEKKSLAWDTQQWENWGKWVVHLLQNQKGILSRFSSLKLGLNIFYWIRPRSMDMSNNAPTTCKRWGGSIPDMLRARWGSENKMFRREEEWREFV